MSLFISDCAAQWRVQSIMAESGDQLIRDLYDELRKLARARLARMRPEHTLQPTALVNEAYLRLVKNRDAGWDGRGHFFGAAARAMRDILVEHARKRASQKRGGDLQRVDMTITFADGEKTGSPEELLALHHALEEMQRSHPDKAELVLLRYFAGLTMDQISELTGTPKRTLERQWRFARAWLRTKLAA